MARSPHVRKPRSSEIRRLHQMLETEDLDFPERRRVEAILLYADGFCVADIAVCLCVHANTIYADLHAFHKAGLAAVHQTRQRGVQARLTSDQEATIIHLAEQSPIELGLPYGRWSLAKLRDYLIRQKILADISREHLRRVLKKGGCAFAGCSANSSVTTRSDQPFWPAFAGFGSICLRAASCYSSTSSQSPSKRMAAGATLPPKSWCWRADKKHGADSTSSPFMTWASVASAGLSFPGRVPATSANSCTESAVGMARQKSGSLSTKIRLIHGNPVRRGKSCVNCNCTGSVCPRPAPMTTRWKPSSVTSNK